MRPFMRLNLSAGTVVIWFMKCHEAAPVSCKRASHLFHIACCQGENSSKQKQKVGYIFWVYNSSFQQNHLTKEYSPNREGRGEKRKIDQLAISPTLFSLHPLQDPFWSVDREIYICGFLVENHLKRPSKALSCFISFVHILQLALLIRKAIQRVAFQTFS